MVLYERINAIALYYASVKNVVFDVVAVVNNKRRVHN